MSITCRRLVPLGTVLALLAVPAAAETSVVRTYDLSGVQPAASSRAPEATFADPTGGDLSEDSRVDVGRLVVDVTDLPRVLSFSVQDDLTDLVPIRLEAYAEEGARVVAAEYCPHHDDIVELVLPEGVTLLVLRMDAEDVEGLCPTAFAGGTRGVVSMTFRDPDPEEADA